MFSELLARYSTTIDPRLLLVNLLVVVVLGYILSLIYLQTVGSGDKFLARIFPVLAATTALAGTLITSSIGIAIGLVGALSIIRFRNVTPHIEQAIFIFLAIGIGLAGGAGQLLLAAIAMGLSAPLLFLVYRGGNLQVGEVEVSLRGDTEYMQVQVPALVKALPGLSFAGLEQEGAELTYYFTFPADQWKLLLRLEKWKAEHPEMQFSLHSRSG